MTAATGQGGGGEGRKSRRSRPRPERAKALIADVARAAGVSTATVSRALTAPDRVLEATRLRVLEAVRVLDYTPNAAARQLRAGRSRAILVVVPKRRNPPFFSEVLHGIDMELSAAGYAMLMGNLDSVDGKEDYLVDLVFGGHLDGAIVLSAAVPARDGRSILQAGIPVVAVCAGTGVAEVPTVVVDDTECTLAQTRHLIGLGHRRLLYIAGPKGNYNEVRRYRGFEAAVREAGLPREDVVRLEGDYVFRAGVEAGQAFLAMARRPTGVVATSDEVAIAFMKTIRAAGVRVPQDVSLVGFDGIEFADFVEPTLTTIRQPRFDLGATGARILLGLLGGESPPQPLTVLHGELVVRDSTAPAPLPRRGGS
ncbi:LacI family DNA-binding transcriptional regulator [Labrys wisconsinensis]|uniref:LacI family repressor for deo operon, udp, cdd, tsx, nupC, and nupG n=1 Tax=Labrys wisconsinensis TaxID=425677 RepID=A0ABU0J1D9_9HYPH|nr:LacI family DNA-binding transcriptional regulator [Labrys wisconsinensis]MDQ0467144.1 LacI family repressor for deo operon, udp, cdd, tsx, nupC, and nupG [Labrys wisconsinensis]